MSYTISQDTEQRKLAVSLQHNSDISAIRLIEAKVNCKSALDEKLHPLSFAAEFHPDAIERNQRTLSVITQFSFKIISDNHKTEVIVLQCRMAAEYILAEGFEPSAEQINAFKEGPAIFNCWPYFREYVQSTVVRMNYPPPTIPFLWLEAKKSAVPELQPVTASRQSSETTKAARKPRRLK
jgi:hypothetical protein